MERWQQIMYRFVLTNFPIESRDRANRMVPVIFGFEVDAARRTENWKSTMDCILGRLNNEGLINKVNHEQWMNGEMAMNSQHPFIRELMQLDETPPPMPRPIDMDFVRELRQEGRDKDAERMIEVHLHDVQKTKKDEMGNIKRQRGC